MRSEWKSATVNAAVNAKLTNAVYLDVPYNNLLIETPAVTNSATISLQVADASDGLFRDLYIVNVADGAPLKLITAATPSNYAWQVPLSGYQYIKVVASADQANGCVFKVCGSTG